METVLIELTNQKAYRLLKELEELKLIRMVVNKPVQLSALRKQIKTKMDNDAIDIQLNKLRTEWQRDI